MQLCIKSYEKICICVRLLQSGCNMQQKKKKKWCCYETCIHVEMYQNEGENLLNNKITIDGTWVRAYEPELKCQSAEWRHEGSLQRQKFGQNPSPVQLIIILAYDFQGVILCHFVPHGETINAQYYAA